MFGLGAGEIILCALAVVIFVGPKKIPKLIKSVGKLFGEIGKVKSEVISEFDSVKSQIADDERLANVSDDFSRNLLSVKDK